MKYMGSKNRHAKHILPIVLKDRTEDQWYVEPFVGGFNVIDKVDGKRIGNDIHFYLTELFKAVRDGWEPPSVVPEDLYKHIRLDKKNYSPELVGFVGFGCSYSGKWFGGYARGNDSKGNPRNYANESRKNILKQADKIKNVIIENAYYWNLHIPPKSIIYCDPPYANTTKYAEDFNHEKFWEWTRQRVKEGHNVFISEYTAPSDFVSVWEKSVNNTLVKNTGSKRGIEKLFVWRNNER